jgi:hypothetical protein
MAYTEFYVDNAHASGNNMNGGSSSGAALFTRTNGNWNSSTRVFTATGDTLDSAWVGQFASVYNDGSTTPVYLARITAVDNSAKTITLDATAKYGTAPTTSTTARTIKVGGVWAGMSGATLFPFSMTNSFMACTNSNGDAIRINIKGGTTYSITASISDVFNYGCVIEGYTTSVGDGGLAKIQYDGTANTWVVNLENSTSSCVYILRSLCINNSTTSVTKTTAYGIRDNIASGSVTLENCRFEDCPHSGVYASNGTNGSQLFLRGCEFVGCGSNAGSGNGCFQMRSLGSAYIENSTFHHAHASAPNVVFSLGTITMRDCVFSDNGSAKCVNAQGGFVQLHNCAFYNSTTALDVTAVSNKPGITLSRCVFDTVTNVYNNSSSVLTAQKAYVARQCGYWNCTTRNNTGSATYLMEEGDISFAHSPMVDPANGDFTIRGSQGRGTMRGHLLLRSSDYSKGTSRWSDLGISANNPYFTGQ